jgi:hypothetical protein
MSAHQQAGKPSLSKLGDIVDYTKSTLSKVFNNKMFPTWELVSELGEQLRVPRSIVMQEWLPLWIAADTDRRTRRGITARGTAAVRPSSGHIGTSPALTESTGYSCPKCGSWVVNTALHTDWHMQHEPQGRTAPDTEFMTADWNADSAGITLLREALNADDEP